MSDHRSPLDGTVHVNLYDMIASLSTALDLLNPALDGHQKRTCYIAARIARQLGVSDKEYETIFVAAALHDIGAIALWERLALLSFEDDNPHQHAKMGALLLKCFDPFSDYADLIKFHHVQWNHGTGATFEGQDVPLHSHLIYLADRIEVLAQNHANILSVSKDIKSRISAKSGSMFHPDFVQAFLEASTNERFWLDLTSKKIDKVLIDMIPIGNVSLDIRRLEELARFFSLVIDSRSHFTATHSAGVATCSELIADKMGLDPLTRTKIKIAGFLHDVGKLAIPNAYIEKPGKLDDDESAVVRTHSYMTNEILSPILGLADVGEWAATHHERLDGTGYPNHMTAQDLPLPARILEVADVYTALTEDRPYRKGMTTDDALAIIREQVVGGKLDQRVFDILTDHIADIDRARIESQKREFHELAEFWALAAEIPPPPEA